MASHRICEECGTELPVNAPQGLCPRCLAAMGLRLAAEDQETLRAPRAVEEMSDRIGRYKLLQKIGEGGYGVVYMAEQDEPVRRRVALKVIKLGMDTKEVLARFDAERQALAMMDHPNIAKAFDAGATETGRPYFVMELVRGARITDYCDQQKLSAAERLNLFVQVCRAVQHAHQKGVIHRDLKPSNILVTLHDGEPVPKVIDFGIAKATQGRLTNQTVFTAFEQFIGTPAYMSPEQAEMSGLDIDTRTDIYSLGVLLYELLTGQTPFDAKQLLASGLDQMRRTIREQEPARPSTRLSTMQAGELTTTANRRHIQPAKLIHLVRGDLDWIVMKCLEKDRTRRYQTANGLAMDIQRHFDNEPVIARPPSKLHRFDRLVRRNKVAFASAAAVTAALVMGLVLSASQAVRARRAERQAQVQATLAGSEAERALRAEKVAWDKSAAAEEQRVRAEQAREALRLSSYVTEMNLALRYAQEKNFAEAWHLLQAYQGPQGGTDLRGFEWRYLYRLCRGNYSRALPTHGQVAGALEFSPDGRLLATYCWDRKLRLWDLENSSKKPVFETNNATGLGGFSADGEHLVFGMVNGSIQIYGITNQLLATALAGAGEIVSFSARSNLVATISSSSDLAAPKRNGGGSVAPERTDGEIKSWVLKVWDLSSGQLRFSLPGLQRRHLEFGWIDPAALDPQGKTLAVVEPGQGPEALDRDLGIRLWDPNTGKELGFLKDNRQIHALRFSPDGRLLAVGDGEGTVNMWDLASGQSKTIRAHDQAISALAFSMNGETLATGSSDQSIKLLDVATGEERTNYLRGQVGTVWSLAFSPDGQRLASGSRDSPVKIWRVDQSESTDEIHQLHSKEYGNFAFSPDGKSIAAGWEDVTIRVLDLETLKVTAVLTGMQYVVAFSGDSAHLLASTAQGLAAWWDLQTKIGEPLPGYSGSFSNVICADLSSDGRLAALGHADGTIQLLEVASGKTLWMFRGHSARIRTLRFSPDANTLVSGGSDGAVALWDVKRQTRLARSEDTAAHKADVCAAVMSHDGKRLASGCGAGTIKLWLPPNLTNALVTMTCHKSALRSLDFCPPDDATLASGGEDNIVKLWNVSSLLPLGSQAPALPREVASFPLTDKVRLVEFSPDGNVLAVVSDDGVLRLLRAISKEEADQEAASIKP